jgi:hypothetical protein
VLGTVPGLATSPFVVVDSVLATLWHASRLGGSYDRPYADCYREVCRTLGELGSLGSLGSLGDLGGLGGGR